LKSELWFDDFKTLFSRNDMNRIVVTRFQIPELHSAILYETGEANYNSMNIITISKIIDDITRGRNDKVMCQLDTVDGTSMRQRAYAIHIPPIWIIICLGRQWQFLFIIIKTGNLKV